MVLQGMETGVLGELRWYAYVHIHSSATVHLQNGDIDTAGTHLGSLQRMPVYVDR